MADRGGSPDHILVGTLGRPHGVYGELFVLIHSDDPERFSPGAVVHVADGLRPLTVSGLRSHTYRRKPRVLVTFEEVTDREGAEAVAGEDLVVPAAAVRELDPHEYWHHDLVGCEVRTVDGEGVGRVTDVLTAPANDLLVVETDAGEALVPMVAAIVRSVDVEARVVVIDPVPGLLGE